MTKDAKTQADIGKEENEANRKKQQYEKKEVKDSAVEGEVQPDQKVVSSQPDPSDPSRWENDPKRNPYAPGGTKFGGA